MQKNLTSHNFPYFLVHIYMPLYICTFSVLYLKTLYSGARLLSYVQYLYIYIHHLIQIIPFSIYMLSYNNNLPYCHYFFYSYSCLTYQFFIPHCNHEPLSQIIILIFMVINNIKILLLYFLTIMQNFLLKNLN